MHNRKDRGFGEFIPFPKTIYKWFLHTLSCSLFNESVISICPPKEEHLGASTAQTAKAMTEFNPDSSWMKVHFYFESTEFLSRYHANDPLPHYCRPIAFLQ